MTPISQMNKTPKFESFDYGSERLPVQLQWYRGESSSKLYSLNYHKEVEIQYFKQGQCLYLVKGREFLLQKNSLLIIRPNEVHQNIPFPNSRIEKFKLMFLPSCLTEGGHSMFPKEILDYLTLTEKEAISLEMILRSIRDELKLRKYRWTEMVRLELARLLLYLRRIRRQPAPVQEDSPLVAKLLAYIEVHFARPVRMATLAGEFGYAEDYLSRCFKKARGLSLKRYLLQRRIVEAKRLLEIEPGLKVDAVAERVGFNDARAFRRVFQSFVDLSPADYRKTVVEEVEAPHKQTVNH